MTTSRLEAVELPWATCRTRGCTGASGPAGACVVHVRGSARRSARAALGRGRPLDARGALIDAETLRWLLAACPKDAGDRPVLNRACFDGATFGAGAGFEGVVFANEVSFDATRFDDDVSFEAAWFDGYARFARTSFAGRAEFDGAEFARQAWFGGTRFCGPASFAGAVFQGLAWFNQADFETDVSFDTATFAGDSTFDGTAFGCHAAFRGTAFEGETTLHRATFNRDGEFDGAAFSGKGEAPQAAVRQSIWSGSALAPWSSRAAAAMTDMGATAGIVGGFGAAGGLLEALQYKGALALCLGAGAVAATAFAVRNLVRQGRTGQTLGKGRFGLCLVRERDGRPVGPGLSLARQAIHLADTVPALLGWLRPLWHPKRQTIADSILTTVVVKGHGWATPGSWSVPERETTPPPGGG